MHMHTHTCTGMQMLEAGRREDGCEIGCCVHACGVRGQTPVLDACHSPLHAFRFGWLGFGEHKPNLTYHRCRGSRFIPDFPFNEHATCERKTNARLACISLITRNSHAASKRPAHLGGSLAIFGLPLRSATRGCESIASHRNVGRALAGDADGQRCKLEMETYSIGNHRLGWNCCQHRNFAVRI